MEPENLFTGCHDVELSEKGHKEEDAAGQVLKQEGYRFDIAYTSYLKRVIRTLWHVLEQIDQMWIPVHKTWRLNERHYGALTGLDKQATVEKHGAKKVFEWRRSYSITPPDLDTSSEYYLGNDIKYKEVPKEELSRAESLELTPTRVLPEWLKTIVPSIKAGKNVVIAAHVNSLRALVKHLNNISEDEITDLNIPTGAPLVYHQDENLKPITHQDAIKPLTAFYLGDQDEIRARILGVKNQTKADWAKLYTEQQKVAQDYSALEVMHHFAESHGRMPTPDEELQLREHGNTYEHMKHAGIFHEREAVKCGRDWTQRAFTVGIGGPVGSGKTALMLALCHALKDNYSLAAVTNDIFTREDGEFLMLHNALPKERIRAIETGSCPHAAIREDISANLQACEDLTDEHDVQLLLVESGGAGGDKVPRKGGPGITQADLLVINKIDLAPHVGADLNIMDRDAKVMRGEGPTVFSQINQGKGVEDIVHRVVMLGRRSTVPLGRFLLLLRATQLYANAHIQSFHQSLSFDLDECDVTTLYVVGNVLLVHIHHMLECKLQRGSFAILVGECWLYRARIPRSCLTTTVDDTTIGNVLLVLTCLSAKDYRW
ncbi:hypothetical protein PsorP6_002178 [Peronosclerospora sorghi]|uniref:Uncharacterized protein n=1 Tax=Peronosclerospora sorghi TaxID=230839 RepID=A0ACC0WXI1_9STRA|nr:hypothetical protein PsorP6_002178 [Peronosclerospora sorghi]